MVDVEYKCLYNSILVKEKDIILRYYLFLHFPLIKNDRSENFHGKIFQIKGKRDKGFD